MAALVEGCTPDSKHIGRKNPAGRRAPEDQGGRGQAPQGKRPTVNVQGTDLKTVTVFRFLRSQIESNGNTDRDIEARLGAARTTFNQVCPLWISKSLSIRAKLKLCKVSVVSIARRGSAHGRKQTTRTAAA